MSTLSRFFFSLSTVCVLVFGFELSFSQPVPNSAQALSTSDLAQLDVIPHMLVVKVRRGYFFDLSKVTSNAASLDEMLSSLGSLHVEAFHQLTALRKGALSEEEEQLTRIYKIRYMAEPEPREAARLISGNPAVEFAEPYYIFPLTHTPDDPRIGEQYAITMMKLAQAWDVTTGDSAIVIGDVDTGIDYNHEDLKDIIWINPGEWGTTGELSTNGVDDDGNGFIDDYRGWDFIGNATSFSAPKPDNDPMDNSIGHGTGTAGCAAAHTNNGKGIASPAYRVKVLPIKTSVDSGPLAGNIGAAMEGITYAVDMGCKIVNCSFGGYGQVNDTLNAYNDVIRYAFSKGVLVVASAGNSPVDNDYQPHYPSSIDHVLSVSSVEPDSTASNWSTYGASVMVNAPGKTVLTTQKGGVYNTPNGTSFSGPLTASVAALVMSVHPEWTVDQVAQQIRVTSEAHTTPIDPKHYGRVNALDAVTKNTTLTDVPGIRLKKYRASTATGDSLTSPGQIAHLTFELENVLAPTSASAEVQIEFENTDLSVSNPILPLGTLRTFETKSLSFDVRFADTPRTSKGMLVIRLRIVDGNYIDFVIGRIPVYLKNAWNTMYNLNMNSFTSLHAYDENNIWATAHYSSGSVSQDICLRSTDGGEKWLTALGSGFPNGQFVNCIRGVGATHAWIGTSPINGVPGVYRTTNGGVTWVGSDVGIFTTGVNWIHMMGESNGVFQGSPQSGLWGICRTTDGGATWSPIDSLVDAELDEKGFRNSYDFFWEYMWFGTSASRIFKSSNFGETWHPIPVPGKNVMDVSFRNSMDGIIRFAQINEEGESGLAITHDGGETWEKVTTIQVPDTAQVLMERTGQRIWLLSDNNALVSSDNGAQWMIQPSPVNFVNITTSDAVQAGENSDVYAAGSAIFKLRATFMKTIDIEPVVRERSIHLYQNYPNPFGDHTSGSASTIIEFYLRTAQDAELTVHDIAGRKIRTVASAFLAPGRHAARIDLTGFPSGIYFATLQTQDSHKSRMMILAR